MHFILLQVLRFCDRTGRHRMLCLDRYADHSSRETWDYSAWIRAYGVFLDERLDAFRCDRKQWCVLQLQLLTAF